MKYLITGGCGFLGSNIASGLLSKDFNLLILDNLSRVGSESNLQWLNSQGKFNFIQGDITNSELIDSIIEQFEPDIIFHFAGQVAMTTSLQDPRLDFNTNALGTLNILEAARKHCPNAGIIYSSTNKVYGDLEECVFTENATRYVILDYPNGLPETMQLSFHSPYGCSKGTADQYILDYARMFGLKTAVFRHSSMYGGRQFSTYDQGWIGWFCQQAVLQSLNMGAEFTISGNGKQVRDILHADDMVMLYTNAAIKLDAISGQAFNIGGGMPNSYSILELLSQLESLLGISLRWHSIAPRDSDQKVFVADLHKITNAIGWSPKISKLEGLKKMIDWTKSNLLSI
jgi:CDP-paratose 2-epimerase